MSVTAAASERVSSSAVARIGSVILPCDSTLLIEARIKAGEPNFQIKAVTNILLHDPILTLDVLQYANSLIFAGAPVTDIEGALSRIGTDRIVKLLVDLNARSKFDKDLIDVMEILRYNCRRVSIVALMVATVVRPTLAPAARVSGLLSDVGHMLALAVHGKKYCDLAKANKRKTLGFRVQKDLGFDLTAMQMAYLAAKGMPRSLVLPYDPESDTKIPHEVELRFIIQSALELVDAYDSKKFATYVPDKPLPAQSSLRLLKVTPIQQERIYKACAAFLKSSEEEEAPEGTSLFVSSSDEEAPPEASKPPAANGNEAAPVPAYQNVSVRASSRDALQGFFELCEQKQDIESLKRKAIDYLTSKNLFNRMAIVRVSKSSDTATVDYSMNLEHKAGDKVSISDPLSPFRAFRTQISSTNIKASNSAKAPFGTSAFAIGPLQELPDGDKVVLYGDLSGSPVLTLEARRIFRLALGLLMQSLRGPNPA